MIITKELQDYIKHINLKSESYNQIMELINKIDTEYNVKCDRLERYRAAVSATFSTPLVPQLNSIEEIIIDKIIDAATERKDAIAANDIHQYDCDVRELTNLIFAYIDLLIEFRNCKE